MAVRNKPGILRITISEDGATFEAEKLPKMTAGNPDIQTMFHYPAAKLGEVMVGTRRARFYIVRGTYRCALIGFLSRLTREEKPQLAIQSLVQYIGLCRALRSIPGGGLRLSFLERFRHAIDMETLVKIMEDINMEPSEMEDPKNPATLYSTRVTYNPDFAQEYEADEELLGSMVQQQFKPITAPQLSQPIIEPS
eukprot:Blabericola_migrator_1__2862@NODE_181_length_11864_cov_121_034161_g157_i0_p6_GENE_NODE_181_length_11864_cov_121_034161_g157_i0NODE_181_length_11864_cov_121_034161_g157_i0_p6_ORF_typecomplete_len195_score21_32_NODE_181_length_11864_cov_121_034161_g157_i086159199